MSLPWVRVLARRLCGYRSPQEWQAEAERATLQLRQQLTHRAADVEAVRELLTLIEQPTPGDLQTWRVREGAHQRQVEARAAQRRQARGFRNDELSEQLIDEDGTLSADALPPPSTDDPSLVQRFDALLTQVTVERLREEESLRAIGWEVESDPVRSALQSTLRTSPEAVLAVWHDAEDCVLYDEFRLREERLRLTAALDALEQRTDAEREAADTADGAEAGRDFWLDWQPHVLSEAALVCERLGVRVLEWTGGDCTELLLVRAEHFAQAWSLIGHIGMSGVGQPQGQLRRLRPFTCCKERQSRCAVCVWQAGVDPPKGDGRDTVGETMR